MTLTKIEHVNIKTSNLNAMIGWYEHILEMKSGPRPNFSFPGAWLYVGDSPAIHLVGTESTLSPEAGIQFEHVAFRGTDKETFLQRLKDNNIEHSFVQIPEEPWNDTQVHIRDHDGNHLHVDFSA